MFLPYNYGIIYDPNVQFFLLEMYTYFGQYIYIRNVHVQVTS